MGTGWLAGWLAGWSVGRNEGNAGQLPEGRDDGTKANETSSSPFGRPLRLAGWFLVDSRRKPKLVFSGSLPKRNTHQWQWRRRKRACVAFHTPWTKRELYSLPKQTTPLPTVLQLVPRRSEAIKSDPSEKSSNKADPRTPCRKSSSR